ncbi:23S rRNA (guanosine2251-2'-O)-methyltransferase [Acetoanaerobium pronyense]|uniref:23S rRNA (Guanosine2251-2'-O)-methyltransferase n=1 Tax=Acetoanaerobium pronyense TaxID=1482736 RepID=A0ABS4KJE9_9FIRM|nr:23S rRNA (guanosine(2251)-2'-O)-methyltransferase RlmB [Acetoanaerobium pronyense]MBP2027910.1 23S rRNA (guanosine2251-2'-O)-methyltransferase [Acetoanaerobium pronyense]
MIISGRNPVIEALGSDRNIDVIYIKAKEKEGSIKKIIAIAKEKKIIIKEVDRKKLDELAEGSAHQGVVAIASEYKYYELEDVLEDIKNKGEAPFFVILDEIEDPHNLGAIIRSAEGAGVHGVIIPKRRSATITQVVEKASAGAVSYMPVIKVTNLALTIDKLKDEGLWIYGLDMDGAPYHNQDMKGSVALIIGNEGKGISRLLKEKCDYKVSIPMKGKVGSLNASVAASIVIYEALRQRGL